MLKQSKNIYSLPYSNEAAVTNIWRGSDAHFGPFVTALDFEMPINNDVVAALDGEVVMAIDGHTAYGPSREFGGSVNYVRLKHANAEYSEYLHLASKSIVVQVGQKVQKGQLLAKTGLSGWMNAPHLHWFVFVYDSSPKKFVGVIPRMDKHGGAVLDRAR